jgi:putative addiction module CopG family antidote
MTITLTPEIEAQLRDRIEPGRYPDAETVIVKALEALDAQEQARFLRTRELVLAGLNSGPGEELTEELWDRLEQEAEEAYQRGGKPSPHVCP